MRVVHVTSPLVFWISTFCMVVVNAVRGPVKGEVVQPSPSNDGPTTNSQSPISTGTGTGDITGVRPDLILFSTLLQQSRNSIYSNY